MGHALKKVPWQVSDQAALAQSLSGVDSLLLHRTRLGICVLLTSSGAPVSFTDLKQLLEETDGSLATHLRKLEEAAYITVEKSFVKRKPLTVYAITDAGKQALQSHLQLMQDLHEKVR